MIEVCEHPEDVSVWHRAATGGDVDWSSFPRGFVASVDWPGGAFWREMADANPSAIILLSTRSSADAWYKSASETIFQAMGGEMPPEWHAMVEALFANRFTSKIDDKAACLEAYDRHNADVRATADPARLVEWSPGDGWAPICAALGVPVPQEPFPHVNTTAEFRAMAGLDGN